MSRREPLAPPCSDPSPVTRHPSRVFQTTWGWMGLAASARGICAVVLPKASRRAAERALRASSAVRHAALAGAKPDGRSVLLDRACAQIIEFLDGRRRTLELPVDLSGGTPFQRRVWRAIQAIPYGRVRSYGWVAARVGGARYARAVGLALGANPVPLIAPCHRVIAADGSLGGFSGGLGTKRRLLALEGTLALLQSGRQRS
ncbi:methylated-DNA--[protein]-cysteine S-methyltransferase [Nitrospira sp. Kam-Ns4a]